MQDHKRTEAKNISTSGVTGPIFILHRGQTDEKDMVCAVTPSIYWFFKWLQLVCVLDVWLLSFAECYNSLRKSFIDYLKLISRQLAGGSKKEQDLTTFVQWVLQGAGMGPQVLLFVWPWQETTQSSMQHPEHRTLVSPEMPQRTGDISTRGKADMKPEGESVCCVAVAADQASCLRARP